MEIYIGDGEFANAPGDDPADAYDAWLEQISEDEDQANEQGLGSEDEEQANEEFDPNWDDDEDWGDD